MSANSAPRSINSPPDRSSIGYRLSVNSYQDFVVGFARSSPVSVAAGAPFLLPNSPFEFRNPKLLRLLLSNFRSDGTEASPSRDMRVLIADDQPDVGRSLAELVRFCNHHIVGVVGSGLDAIQAYTRLHPDLVLMDYRMPKLNGATACRNILSKDPLARVILVTAWSPSDEASQSGAIAILPKPVDLERLNATLQAVAQMLPVPSPAEMPIPEVCYQPDSIDYFPPVAQPLPVVVASSTEMPIPDICYQPDSIDYFPPVAQPLPLVPPSLETSFPDKTPQNHLQQTGEACALKQKKNKTRLRSPNRHHVR
jgi:two-component system chemotaxis response regulator CheY